MVDSCTDPFAGDSFFRSDEAVLIVDKMADPQDMDCASMSAQQCTCSCKDKYQVTVATEIPSSGTHRLMVAPLLLSGKGLPMGIMTEVLIDRCELSSDVFLEWCFNEPLPVSDLYCPPSQTHGQIFRQ